MLFVACVCLLFCSNRHLVDFIGSIKLYKQGKQCASVDYIRSGLRFTDSGGMQRQTCINDVVMCM